MNPKSKAVTTTTNPKTLTRDLKVTKTQVVLAGIERYKQRQQAKIDAADFDKIKDKFTKDMLAQIRNFERVMVKDINQTTSIKRKFISAHLDAIGGCLNYVDAILSADMPFLGITDRHYRVGLHATYNQAEKDESLPKAAQECLAIMRDLIVSHARARADHTNLMRSLNDDALKDVRRRLKNGMMSTQQLDDMQVARALVASTEHCQDIDAVLDAFESK